LRHRILRNLVHARAIVDYRGVIASPGAILLEGNCIIAAGTPQELGTPEDAELTQVDSVITPSFVNTHTHMDLSGVGLAPARDSFVQWVEEAVLPIRRDIDAIEENVRIGIALSIAGGSLIVGDIAGTQLAAEIVESSALLSLSFVELLGLGQRQNVAIEKLSTIPTPFGVSPHAPFSCGKALYEACFESGRRIATHLAETLEEIESVRDFHGPLVEYAIRAGSWDDTVESWNEHPIDAVLRVAGEKQFIAAHLNYIEDHHLPMLAASNMTVAYCPRASHYFGHINHRWKEMLEVGINVALGTDSLLCLDTPDRISVIDEMRYLHKESEVDPIQLLTMGTINGAIGLGFDPNLVTLDAGDTAGLLAFDSLGNDPLFDIFNATTMPNWL